MGSWVTSVRGPFMSIFNLIRPSVRDLRLGTRQTDRRRPPTLNAPLYGGEGTTTETGLQLSRIRKYKLGDTCVQHFLYGDFLLKFALLPSSLDDGCGPDERDEVLVFRRFHALNHNLFTRQQQSCRTVSRKQLRLYWYYKISRSYGQPNLAHSDNSISLYLHLILLLILL